MFVEKRFAVALHERVIQRPPGQAQQWHPDQFFFQEELEEGDTPVEHLDQRRDIDPALVVADGQVGCVQAQVIGTAHVPHRGDAQTENQFVDFRPGFGDPHHRP
ncbi:hypothetical protein D3C77_499550 [compost metagenome]